MNYMVLMTILWSWLGTLAIFKTLIPPDFFRFIDDYKRNFLRRWSIYFEFVVPEYSGAGNNDLYNAVHLFVSSRSLEADAESLVVEVPRNGKQLHFVLGRSQFVHDEYDGQVMKWERLEHERQSRYDYSYDRSYKLIVPKSAKPKVPAYLNHLLLKGKEIEKQAHDKKLYTNIDRDYWAKTSFNPPTTFDTLAMDPETKQILMDDLKKFTCGKDFYASVGRAWKRGYLLYGPPGTGKSSLIGAISNYTGYDVYDLELTRVKSNLELRQLLLRMNNRAIVVVEDIDCSMQLHNRDKMKKVEKEEPSDGDIEKRGSEHDGITLSGFLNFIDGLWSCCGSERIFVLTTNYVDKLDPALLRPGRMDMKICMSYCRFPVFKSLVSTYLKVEEHALFMNIEELLYQVDVTPAWVVEMLLRYGSDVDLALENILESLKEKGDKIQSQVSLCLKDDEAVATLGDESPRSLE